MVPYKNNIYINIEMIKKWSKHDHMTRYNLSKTSLWVGHIAMFSSSSQPARLRRVRHLQGIVHLELFALSFALALQGGVRWIYWLDLVGSFSPTLKNDGVKVTWDHDIPNIWKVIKDIKAMFQSTNQIRITWTKLRDISRNVWCNTEEMSWNSGWT